MKFPFVVLFLALPVTGAMAQSRDNNGQNPPVIASPFQALGNVLRNPDADRPRPPRRDQSEPAPPPTIIPPGTLANPDASPQPQMPPPPR